LKFYQAFKEEKIIMLFKLFHKIEREGMLPNSLYEVSITLMLKPEKKKRKLWPNSLDESIHKILNKIFAN
jgi:hypothetical protein